MSYLIFDKKKLVDSEYSLQREMLSTNRMGSFMCSTIICCNTRKYHGLLITPIQDFGGESYVLLSSLDETIIEHNYSFNLAIHQYPNNIYEPNGHKYIEDFEFEPTPTLTYRVGNVVLKKEFLMKHNANCLLIRYTLLDANSSINLKLRPMLAYRSRHSLSKANLFVNKDYDLVDNGMGTVLYKDFPVLYMQLNKKNHYVSNPDWYYNIQYQKELERGYDYLEDLYTPGYFDISLEKGESVVFSASLTEENSSTLLRSFKKEQGLRSPKNNFISCLKNSASQFIVKEGKDTEIVAGYPWFGRWGRDTFIALPGITLANNNDPKACKAVLDTMSREVNNGLFPNIGKHDAAAYNSVDAPMWYFWAIQKYAEAVGSKENVWNLYGKKMKGVLNAFREGIGERIKMHDNGLIWSKQEGRALTWMDAVVDGVPVTPRAGYVVEINALWYNAMKFTLELAKQNGDDKFIKEWEKIPTLIEQNFMPTFWNDNLGYLADFVDENGQNMDLRPNQVIATSLLFTLIKDDIKSYILTSIKQKLLTPKGLRTLSPDNKAFKGIYSGDQKTRDYAYHQGTVWVWLLGHYVEASFKLYGNAFVNEAKKILEGFKDEMTDYGICSVAEVYDGNPPHNPGGSISQAWSVSEILRIIKMIEEHSEQ